ncbi:MAG: single-stranded DNA-binding protein [Dorea sp.]|nr:single-stranded DNA-binding protein [Dorea sp.]
MNGTRHENNYVTLKGSISGNVLYSHEYDGERFYATQMKVERKSHLFDRIQIMIPEMIMHNEWTKTGMIVEVKGQYRSHNNIMDGKLKLELAVYVREYHFTGRRRIYEPVNEIYLEGYLCKAPLYRKTPSGKEIADILLAVNRDYRKTDYVPCICWGKNARIMRNKKQGSRVRILGRIQSRIYAKRELDGSERKYMTYEVSISNMEFFL